MKVVVFGDSIGEGQWVSPHRGWVHLLSEAIPDVLVVNASQNGDTTRTALLRMSHDVPGCDVIVVQFGLNDCNEWVTEDGAVRVYPESFAANLYEIAQRASPARVILHTNHRTNKGAEYDRRALRYNELIRGVATRIGSILVDFELLSVPLLDGLHPSPEGHQVYAQTAIPVIQKALGR